MTHQRDHAREHADFDLTVDVGPTPGRRSASANLATPNHPIPSGIVMRKGDGAVTEHADDAVARASSGAGQQLPGELQSRFEDSLGTDLSSVRIHTGGESETAAQAVAARAYTLGNDIHFASGQYNPSSVDGQHLIAHEVAHTVQQRGGSPHRQHKLEVSSPGDSFEHEADRAADAMVAGQSASVGGSSGLARKIQRFTDPNNPRNSAGDESLLETIQEDKNPQHVANEMGWGMEHTTKEDGSLDNRHDNVIGMGSNQLAMQTLSQEVSVLKPLHLAWIKAASSVNSIREATGIEPNSPDLYADSVKELGAEMHQSTQLGKDLSARIKDVSVDKLGAASSRIKGALAKVNSARSALTAYQTQLKIEETKAEQDKEKEKLAAIRAEIKMVAGAIKTVASLALDFSKAQAATIAAVGAVTQQMRDTKAGLKDKSKPNATLQGANTRAEQGGKAIKAVNDATGADAVEKVLEWTLYASDIKEATDKINALGTQLEGLGISAKLANTAALTSGLTGTQADFDAAKQDAAHTNREFFLAMNQVGRDWDQRQMSDAEKRDPFNALAYPSGSDKYSMEAILSMYAALQVRGNARQAFADQAASNPTLDTALQTIDKGLKSPMMFDVGDGQVGQADLDSKRYQATLPDPKVMEEAQAVRSTVGNILAARNHLATGGAAEQANEAAWVQMISTASTQKIK
jgi:hypothetical protein